jgi:hypothetical protein
MILRGNTFQTTLHWGILGYASQKKNTIRINSIYFMKIIITAR